ncbi:MAG: hypothetical protein HZA17_03480 [Nitrospirae bacterium]|nr:hypothetical protein [Nitrospirota bacterium]
MIDLFGIATSALRALSTRLNVTAHNIANLNTEDFRPSKTTINEDKNNGVYVTISRNSQAEEVDIAGEMTELIITESSFKANLKTLRTAEETEKSVLDIIA